MLQACPVPRSQVAWFWEFLFDSIVVAYQLVHHIHKSFWLSLRYIEITEKLRRSVFSRIVLFLTRGQPGNHSGFFWLVSNRFRFWWPAYSLFIKRLHAPTPSAEVEKKHLDHYFFCDSFTAAAMNIALQSLWGPELSWVTISICMRLHVCKQVQTLATSLPCHACQGMVKSHWAASGFLVVD